MVIIIIIIIISSLWSKSDSQLSKYCVLCEISWCRCQQFTALVILISTVLVTKLLVFNQLLHPALKFGPEVRRECPTTYFAALPLLATNAGDAIVLL